MKESFFGRLSELFPGGLVVNSSNKHRHNLASWLMGGNERVKIVGAQGDREELTLDNYLKAVGDNFNIVYYVLATALSKVMYRDYGEEYGAGRGILTVDTVNVVKTVRGWEVMEKPKNRKEAEEQLRQVVESSYLLNVNATTLYYQPFENWGFSVWGLPIKYVIPNSDRSLFWQKIQSRFGEIGSSWTPGGLSGVDDALRDYLFVGIFSEEVKHELVGDNGEIRNWDERMIKWFKFNNLPRGIYNGLYMTIAGVSPFGVRRAGMRLVANSGVNYRKKLEEQLEMIGAGK